ncbi:MAG TPA: metal-dependent transcriptional regulator [Anaerovoracaceae bacterium]|nr:metal-dependent transcriptional regulator [Anaerovoracaceae bacterium]
MGIYESGENYLETILLLEKRNGRVRSIDIANQLAYSKPSISRAMGILREGGYIIMAENGDIILTEKGRNRANGIYERHKLITEYLVRALGVDVETANEDACRIEHIISEHSFEKIKAWVSDQPLQFSL